MRRELTSRRGPGRRGGVVNFEVHSARPHRPEAQDVALSRPKHGFESRWGRTPFLRKTALGPLEKTTVVLVLLANVRRVRGLVPPLVARSHVLTRHAGEQFVKSRLRFECVAVGFGLL